MQDKTSHIIIIFLLTFITINLFILDLKVFSPSSAVQLSDITSAISPIPTQATNYPLRLSEASQLQTTNLLCPNSCLSAIQQATSSASQGSLQEVLLQKASGQSREFYIPLGTGSTNKSDWDDLTSTEITIDPVNYGKIKEAYLIVSLSNPTQNGAVEAQLYNATDKHLVWGSHAVMSGPAKQTVTSDKITLDTGNKLYRMQLKSTLQYPVTLDNAKIRIVTQ